MKLLSIVAVSAIVAQAVSAQNPERVAGMRYAPERCGCYEVEIPEDWRFPQPATTFGRLVFRQARPAGLLVGATAGGLDSLHRFLWVPPVDNPVAKAVRIQQWRWTGADPVETFSFVLDPEPPEGKAPDRVVFRQLEYGKRGAHWLERPAMPSPDGGLIALQSYNSAGSSFLDVFDAITAAPVCRIDSTRMLEDSQWLSGRELAATAAGTGGRRFLMCRFRGNAPASRPLQSAVVPTAVAGRLISFEDRAVDEDGNGQIDRLEVTALVQVSEAGVYQFDVQLQKKGDVASASEKAVLGAGQSRIRVAFPAKALFLLGDGPYARVHASLAYQPVAGRVVRLDERERSEMAVALPLDSLDRGPVLRLSGKNSAAGVTLRGDSQYDQLAVRVGVHSTGPADCEFSGDLYHRGISIEHVSNGYATLRPGENTLALFFSGRRIREMGKDGPYQVGNLWVRCSGQELVAREVFTTEAFRAEQFRAAAKELTFTVQPASVQLAAGSNTFVRVHVDGVPRGMTPLVGSAEGFPEGVQALIRQPILREASDHLLLHVFAFASAAPGEYRPLVRFTQSNGATQTLPLRLTITPQVGFSVAAWPPGPSFAVNGAWHEAPASFRWTAGSQVTLGAVSLPGKEGLMRYTFLKWSDGGAMKHTVTVPEGNASYVAHFKVEYWLHTRAVPAQGGKVIPDEGFQLGHVPIPVKAVPNPGYAFAGWADADVKGGANGTIVLAHMAYVAAKFVPAGKVSLAWEIVDKSGMNPRTGTAFRTWQMQLSNDGEAGMDSVEMTRLTLRQTAGAECGYQLQESMPRHVGPLVPGESRRVDISLAAGGCGPDARFEMKGEFRVNQCETLALVLSNQTI